MIAVYIVFVSGCLTLKQYGSIYMLASLSVLLPLTPIPHIIQITCVNCTLHTCIQTSACLLQLIECLGTCKFSMRSHIVCKAYF